MSRSAAAATVALATAVLAARPAAADGLYVGESFGVTRFHGDLALDDAFRIRVGAGYRTGRFAVEAWVAASLQLGLAADTEGCGGCAARTTLPGAGGSGGGPRGDAVEYGLDAKLVQPVSTHWSLYARGGLSYMEIGHSYGGRGLGATAGIQVAGRVPVLGYLWWPLFFLNKGPKVHSALFFEAGSSFHRLRGDGPTMDARTTTWLFGFAVGQDF